MSTIIWQPQQPEKSRMWHFMRYAEQQHKEHFTDYQQLHRWSIQQPALFWETLVNYFGLTFTTPPKQTLSPYQHMMDARWFEGATFNFAEKLLNRRDNHPAIVSIDEAGHRQKLSYRELRKQVARCTAGLKKAGVGQGDRVAAVMPNITQTIIAMLATASLGATWSSCSPDFGEQAIIDRLGQIEPKILFICDGHQYMGKIHDAAGKILAISNAIPSLKQLVICPFIHESSDIKPVEKATTWDNFLQPAEDCEFLPMPFNHPLYILFSSGTTGKPKCIVHGAGGTLLQHMKELGLHSNIDKQDNLCFYTTCGWMMWNWMVSVLALGATLTLYEGAPTHPDVYRLFKILADEKITVFGTSAKFISAIEKANAYPNSRMTFPHLKTILSTGSPLLPKNYDFVYQHIKSDLQLSSISGGTDIISCFALGNPVLPVRRGELQCFGLGMAVDVFDEQGKSIVGERGELVCTKPFPSMPVGFLNDPDRNAYRHAYFDHFNNVWAHGDFAEITPDHGLIIHGRSDSVLNPGGVRIGTAEIYRQIETISDILDSVVIGQNWQDDVRVVLFVKLRDGKTLNEELQNLIRQTIRSHASPRHVPAVIIQVPDIPKTISGKTVEVAVRKAVHDEPINNLQTLANPDALEHFKNRPELQV
ncbi:acetoacetate--CoA ligase [Legionella spiritensis]|uniref:Acetoacetyl CoA synthetase n=1 Tax=Legionella spiritensis TaxID=452 RepID=A0A0W0YX57_LEGSP|nr:acetoacetate--CoA ligase [Legionella spiritensis]KTD61419.1 acetoacetyl CoA synthetase [Legionella spiritensis]SNV33396.1 acetoacetyl CoA synthetase [Legionella spiritensis]